MDTKAYMICHTHWDREWYLTKEEFRTKLVRLIDGLLNIVENNSEYVSFMLDGQTIVIEDYLAVKPYNRERLFHALREGKIICGPWYILPDELLISGESHIRNYIKGVQVVKDAGKRMDIAYLPDSFGHPAQMPQIVEGLGMNTMVFWRGISNQVEKSEFYWESPYDASRILCVHMPHGYGNSGNLSSNMDVSVPRVKELLHSLREKSTTNTVLLMNGSDHITGQEDICEVVKKLNEQIPECRIQLSTMENYLNELREQIDKQFRIRSAKGSDPFELSTFRGEFRSGERSMLLGGTLSTRMYLKQQNEVVQNKAERYLEPMLALEKIFGQEYDSRGYMDYIWKRILENQPHDSICGCSIDAVHREMVTRFACVEQLEDMLMQDVVIRSGKDHRKENDREAGIFLFEPTVRKCPAYAELEICLDEMLVQSVDFTKSVIVDCEDQICHPQIPSGIRITDETGRVVPHVILEAKKDYTTLYQDHTMPEIYKVNKIRAGVLLPGFTFGYHQLFVQPDDTVSVRCLRTEEPEIENEFYRIRLDGIHLTLLDKRTGRELDGFARLIDRGDAGDEYTYSWPQEDREYTDMFQELEAEKVIQEGICQSLCLRGTMMLPESLSTDRKMRKTELAACPFFMKFTLIKDINRIDCHIEFDNHAKDHRLQIQFPSEICTKTSESYHIFGLAERPVEPEITVDWMEYPQSTHPAQGYISVHDEQEAMSVGTLGLPEFEAAQTNAGTALNITLLRCVGWLSRTDLLTRHGNGGWTIETEEAQCQGENSFDLCVIYHSNEMEEAFGMIEKFRYPSYTHPMKIHEKIRFMQGDMAGFLDTLPRGVQLSALKTAEDQQGVILRIYSIYDKKQNINLDIPGRVRSVYLANLAEEKKTELEIVDGMVALEISPYQIITIYMGIAAGEA